MTSRTTRPFREAFANLQPQVRNQARRAYRLFKENPHQARLHFKSVHPSEPIWSVRVGDGYRAVGVRSADEIVWFWIGSHADYDKLLSQRRRRS